MPAFVYLARDRQGRSQQGQLEGASAQQIAQQLRGRGLLVIKVDQPTHAPTLAEQLDLINPWRYLPPRSVDIELGCKQLAVMLRAGISLLSALQAIGQHTSRRTLRQAWQHVTNRLQEGASFAAALEETKRFPSLMIQLVRVGEQTGQLEQTLERAADSMESRRRLRTSLLTALAYPSLVLVAALGVTAFMVVSVIPKMKIFLGSLGRQLPPITKLLIDIADWVQTYLPHITGTILALLILSVVLYYNPASRLVLDRLLLRLPVLGNLFRLAGTAGFARSLGILIRSGITLLEGLRTVEGLMSNRYLASRVLAARQAVLRGGNLADPLAESHTFTPLLSRMVAVGESSGTIDDVLDEAALFHEQQLQASIRTLSVIIEPVIIIVVGGIVGFVYIAFFMALFAAAGSR